MIKLLSIEEASSRLGIKTGTLRSWCTCRRISFIKIGRLTKIEEQEILNIIERGRRPAREG
jgi:excisionase family DNA binding protein